MPDNGLQDKREPNGASGIIVRDVLEAQLLNVGQGGAKSRAVGVYSE